MSDDGNVYAEGSMTGEPIATKNLSDLKDAIANATVNSRTASTREALKAQAVQFMVNGASKKEAVGALMIRAEPVLTTRQGRRRATREGKL